MVSFIHTADWQLGLKLNFLADEQGAIARNRRFDTLSKMAAIARERQVDAVLIAGDAFDSQELEREVILKTRDALKHFGDIPLYVIPGNHDPLTGANPWLAMSDCCRLRLLISREPVALSPGAMLFPCPEQGAFKPADPSEHLPYRQSEEEIWIAMAHGSCRSFGDANLKNAIDVPRVIGKGFDYLALGDWHGTKQIDARCWYAGAHEPTRFKEKDAGNILHVEISQAGAVPRVEKLKVAHTYWEQKSFHFHEDKDLDHCWQWFQMLAYPTASLLELKFSGVLSLAGFARLEHLLAEMQTVLLYLRVHKDDLWLQREASVWPEGLNATPFLQQVWQQLASESEPEAQDALRLLYRYLQQEEACR